MSFYVDVKYLQYISPKFERFQQKKPDLFNVRCPICGDSKTDKKKMRGYFYREKDDMFYKCHNCDVSKHFSSFLKDFDPTLHTQYVFEKYRQDTQEEKKEADFSEVVWKRPEVPESKKTLRQIATPLSELSSDHPAIQYWTLRKLPLDRLSDVYYIDETRRIVEFAPSYKNEITGKEPRIVFPFTMNNELVGVTMRAIGPSGLRYLMVKKDTETPSIFGYDSVDQSKTFYVTEGPIDSLFLPNAMACCGTSFGKLDELGINKKNAIVVIDNQPRNREVVGIYDKYIAKGFRVCIWPNWVHEKDINDMVLNGRNPKDIIDQHAVSGLMATINFTQWRKIK